MAKTDTYDLVIVESPAKAKTIEKFLGGGYVVKSSYGHIRDLQKQQHGVDIGNNYEPLYEVPEEKNKVVSELRSLQKQAAQVWLASDEDREGEAISWHLAEVLGLDVAHTKRIVFHEITKEAILNAIKTPRTINMDLVNAQQARRVMDRLMGFELSPILWHKIKPQLSAGRVQSVALRLLVEREREIFAFKGDSSFPTTAIFKVGDNTIKAELGKRFANLEAAKDFLTHSVKLTYLINSVETKPAVRTPAPPFTTSTLQQEAARKLGFSVSATMNVAQKLYEAGHITYMRTDSVNLAKAAQAQIAEYVTGEMGDKYLKVRNYKTKQKGAQEAHEAIRPTYVSRRALTGVTQQEQRLYNLIWQRAVASQMSDAQFERTTIKINAADGETFTSAAEVVLFDGFMKVYTESRDDDEAATFVDLPSLKEGQPLDLVEMQCRERFAQHPPRYNEATLVKKLEEMGVGRPSTYAPTISNIQQRGYVIRESREGEKRDCKLLTFDGQTVRESVKTEVYGAEKSKLFPTDIGMLVTDFLNEYFDSVINYDFTAKVEEQFDEIAEGKVEWRKVIDDFYKPFHEVVETTLESGEKKSGERKLGVDPKTGKTVLVRVGRFGPVAQIGETAEEEAKGEKPRFASLRKDQHVETITLEEALKLFDLPRKLGLFEGKEVTVGVGRFGPYVLHSSKFTALKKGVDDPYTIDLQTAITRIEEKREADVKKTIKVFDENPDVKIMNGRFGPYIAWGRTNIRIPKTIKPEELTYEECERMNAEVSEASGAKKPARSEAKTAGAKATAKAAAKTEKTTAKRGAGAAKKKTVAAE